MAEPHASEWQTLQALLRMQRSEGGQSNPAEPPSGKYASEVPDTLATVLRRLEDRALVVELAGRGWSLTAAGVATAALIEAWPS